MTKRKSKRWPRSMDLLMIGDVSAVEALINALDYNGYPNAFDIRKAAALELASIAKIIRVQQS